MTNYQPLSPFVEGHPRPPFDPESFAYGDAVVAIAATSLREDIHELAASPDPSVVVQLKTNPKGATSPVTKYDKATERLIGAFFEGTNHRVKGEEKATKWPKGKVFTATHHTDPIDGTELFTQYIEALIAWIQLPEKDPPPRPVCGSMVSDGVVLSGSNVPVRASIAAPFIHPNGIIQWSAAPEVPAVRTEPDGSQHRLARASTLWTPDTGGVILAASDSTETLLEGPLQKRGLRVIKLKSVVAAALCVMDPGLFERIRPGELRGATIVGTVARTAEDWDTAGVVAIADQLGFSVTGSNGEPRTCETGSVGLVLTTKQRIGNTILRELARI